MPITEEELFRCLAALGIESTTVRHPPVFTVEEARRVRDGMAGGTMTGGHCKNLFLKDKKGVLWLVVTFEDRAIDMKQLQKTLGAARLSFGRPELLMEILGVEPGAVTPFALANDTRNRVRVILDAEMMAEEWLNYHPLTNQATTRIAAAGLLAFIRAQGHRPEVIDLS